MENESLTRSEIALARSTLNPIFSHLYIEKRALDYALTKSVLERLPNCTVVEIDNYKGVFNRRNQSWPIQKMTPKLIIAVNDAQLISPITDLVLPGCSSRSFYSSQLLNCVYDCHYCYLQGLYKSPNFVLFVNSQDFFRAARTELSRGGGYNLAISYDSDLLAVEGIFGLCRNWIEFGSSYPEIMLEIRTKSANYKALKNITPIKNLILSWTLSPQAVIDAYEAKTPSLDARLNAIINAAKRGFKIKLCFDPILAIENWREIYAGFLSHTFSKLAGIELFDFSVGTFRMNREHFKAYEEIRGGAAYLKSLEKASFQVSLSAALKHEIEATILNEIQYYRGAKALPLSA